MNDKEKVVRRLEGEDKYLWCPKCKCFPDRIIEKNILWEARIWHKGMKTYQWDDNANQDEEVEWSKCATCKTELEDKE